MRPQPRSRDLSLRSHRRRDRQPGFTLFEVMVALAIAVLVLASVIRAFGGVWMQARASSEITAATVIARSLLANARTQPITGPTRSEGDSNGFHWRLTGDLLQLDLPPPSANAPARPNAAPPPQPGAAPGPDQTPGQPPADQGAPHAQDPLQLFRFSVDVAARSGRHVHLETLVASAPKQQQP